MRSFPLIYQVLAIQLFPWYNYCETKPALLLFTFRSDSMLFNSLDFLIFFPVVLLAYHVIPNRFKHLFLLGASYYFYMCWDAQYALLLLFSTLVTYLCALGIDRVQAKSSPKAKTLQKCFLSLGLILNLLILFFFKYFHFATDLIHSFFGLFGISFHRPSFDILLPVGISFYTFQALGYMIDVYRNETKAEGDFFRYALFVSFFPQLVAGPIERSMNLLNQLRTSHRPSFHRVLSGILIMLWGFFLKIVLADHIAIFVDSVYGDISAASGVQCLVATLLFAVQIYCDFYGYSSIATGSAKLFGIDLMENFHAPYFSTSVAQFWRNWHISLTSWFKDYLYIPLGGNKHGLCRKWLNKFLVFLFSGLWHGASINFVIWGGINGLYQIGGEVLAPFKSRLASSLRLYRDHFLYKVIAAIFTFVLIDFSWIFFRANSLHDAILCINTIFTQTTWNQLLDGSLLSCGLNEAQFSLIGVCILILCFADAMKCKGVQIRHWIISRRYLRWFILAIAAFIIILLGIWGPEYDQTAFIYFQF